MIKDKFGGILGTSFDETAIFDFRCLAEHMKKLGDILGNWNTLEKLPITFWKTTADKDITEEVLARRKEIDVAKFREPATAELMDINRCLATLGMGEIGLGKFINKSEQQQA